MNNKIILSLMLGIMLLSICSANLGGVIQGKCIDIRVLANCSSVDLVEVTNSQVPITYWINSDMTQNGQTWNYTFCNTTNLGTYSFSWNNPCVDCSQNDCGNSFDVTPSGNSGSSNIVFFLFIIIMLYAIALLGFFGKNIPITVLGGMAMVGLGVYLVRNGIIIYRDWLTNYFSYVTIGLGALLALWAIIEMIQEEFS